MLAADDVPEPYASLLVHKNDMTPTLERYYGNSLHLDVLAQKSSGSTYSRKVCLLCNNSGEIVEFGAIMIFLDLFPENAKRLILEGQIPLGAILRDEQVAHHSDPTAYFKIESDLMIQQMFNLEQKTDLYGRCNLISTVDGSPLAKIVEILPKSSKNNHL